MKEYAILRKELQG